MVVEESLQAVQPMVVNWLVGLAMEEVEEILLREVNLLVDLFVVAGETHQMMVVEKDWKVEVVKLGSEEGL